jgi:predicted RNase H-like HicB family nuclease
MKIKVIVEERENGYFVAHCPSLKSCWSQGKTEEEALKNIQEAIGLYLEPDEDLIEDSKHKVYEVGISLIHGERQNDRCKDGRK